MVGDRFQPENMRNGQWHSSWRITNHKAIGHIKVIVHYFEDGNVQLNTDRIVELEWDGSSYDSLEAKAQALVEKIRDKEDTVQLAINESYLQLSEATFKKLRRQLPVTRSKVDW